MTGEGSARARAGEVERILASRYPGTTLLAFTSPWSLLVAAILAAQCTDERVNLVTSTLFKSFPTPESFAGADQAKLEEAIHSTGFYRQKAATLIAMNRFLVERFGGKLPDTPAELVKLPGVGRKTANLVLGNALDRPAIFVDTHVKRLAMRLGFTVSTDPDTIEADLDALIEPARRTIFSNNLTHLGRELCKARNPRCAICPVTQLCPRAGL